MHDLLINNSLCFDDVLIVPKYSEVRSRDEVDLSTKIGSTILLNPFISANMDTVTEERMFMAMRDIGGFGFIHRFMSDERRLEIAKSYGRHSPAMAIGLGKKELELAVKFADFGVYHMCLDVAHGDHILVYEMVEKLLDETKWVPDFTLTVGNVCTQEATRRLYNAGCTSVKVGIGPGAVCQTRTITGCGYPQLSAIAKCAQVKGVEIIADGGLKNSGDCVKALAAGATTVMSGYLFAGCDEAAGNRSGFKKQYRGMASTEAQKTIGKNRAPEGTSAMISTIGSVADTVRTLCEGIQSGCSYVGAYNLAQLRENAEFVRVTTNSVNESRPRLI